MLLDGLFVPLTTPFYRDGALYARKVEHNVDRLSRSPAAGLVAFTDAGEGRALTDAETLEAMHSIASVAAKDKVLLAALRRDSVHAALELAAAAALHRFDAVILGAPAGWHSLEKPRGSFLAQLHTWFSAVADRSPLPVVLHSGDASSGVALPWESLAELSQHPNILGVVDDATSPERLAKISEATVHVTHEVTVTTVFAAVTGRMLQRAETEVGSGSFVSAEALGAGSALATAPPVPALKTRTKRVGFQVMAAGGGAMLPMLEAGVRAVMPTLAAGAPQACHEVLAAFRDGDPRLAAEKEERLREAVEAVVNELGVAALKYACDLNGYSGGSPRLPLLPLSGEQKGEVQRVMRNLRS